MKEKHHQMVKQRYRKQVVCSQENLKILDLIGRLGISETAKHLSLNPSTIHNRVYGICDRLKQGQTEINQVRGLMTKYSIVRRLLTPSTLRPTERDLEPDLYEDGEEKV